LTKPYNACANRRQRDHNQLASETIADRNGFTPVMLAADHDLVGIVTAHDGRREIITPEVGTDLHDASTFHNNFQEPELKEEEPKPAPRQWPVAGRYVPA
jgi:hypothetical protein